MRKGFICRSCATSDLREETEFFFLKKTKPTEGGLAVEALFFLRVYSARLGETYKIDLRTLLSLKYRVGIYAQVMQGPALHNVEVTLPGDLAVSNYHLLRR